MHPIEFAEVVYCIIYPRLGIPIRVYIEHQWGMNLTNRPLELGSIWDHPTKSHLRSFLMLPPIQLHTVLVVTSTAKMLGSIGTGGVVGNPYRKTRPTRLCPCEGQKCVCFFWEARGAVFGDISKEDKLKIIQCATRALSLFAHLQQFT